jgi:aspartyl-tRNA(Asn)/glutamyl-tRNA(Gln) amidotransferase subunit C
MLDKETIYKIAHLARIEVKEEEMGALLQDLNNILQWVDQLNEVDTTAIEPLVHLGSSVNVLREDTPHPPLGHQEALKLAPRKNSDYYLVPKVLDTPS